MANTPTLPASFLSRERAAGYIPDLLRQVVVLIVGMGAAGTNLLLTLVLSGIHKIRVADSDQVEPSNVTRSPLFRLNRLGKKPRMKAMEAGLGLQAMGVPALPDYRYAISKIEALGLGAIAEADVVVGCVDSNQVRALLADWTRLMETPYIELGFRGEHFNVSVFPNHHADEPCWWCLHPEVQKGGISCTTYATQAVSSGLVPAIQATAAASAAIVAEAVIQAVHGQYPLGNRRLHLDIRTGRSDVVELATDSECPGVHAVWSAPVQLVARGDSPVAVLFQELGKHLEEPRIELPFPFVHKMPCSSCGRQLQVDRPSWQVETAPCCQRCPSGPAARGAGSVVMNEVGNQDPVGDLRCSDIGLPTGSFFRAYSPTTQQTGIYRLAGKVDEEVYQKLFTE